MFSLLPPLTHFFFFFLTIPPPPTSTLFPYTTLFRSLVFGDRRPPRPRAGPLGLCCDRGNLLAKQLGVAKVATITARSEEHTSELQSRGHLVCRLLLEKKKHKQDIHHFKLTLVMIRRW